MVCSSCCISSHEHRLQAGVEGYETLYVHIISHRRSEYLFEDYPVASLDYLLSTYLKYGFY